MRTNRNFLLISFIVIGGLLCCAGLALVLRPPMSRQSPFNPPSGTLMAGLRETAAHRDEPLGLPSSSHKGFPKEVSLWFFVSAAGHVLDVKKIDDPGVPLADIKKAAEKLTYKPFLRDGQPSEAWVQDTLSITAMPDRTGKASSFPEAKPGDTSIALSRSGCLGSCPVYSISIQGDGTVTYNGRYYVSIAGVHTTHISVAAVNSLLQKFKDANFFALKNKYVAGVTDNPTYCLSLKIGPHTKTITDYVGSWVGMPAEITKLEDAVDETADSARWVSASPGSVVAMQEAGIASNSPEAINILFSAVLRGDLLTTRELLHAGTPLESTQDSKAKSTVGQWSRPRRSLLEVAVESQHHTDKLAMVRLLLNTKIIPIDPADKQSALAHVVEEGEVDLAQELIRAGANPALRFTGEYADQDKDETYLMLAAASGVWEMLDDALRRPHDIHAVDANGRTALVQMVYSAPQQEDIFPLVDKLLAAGAGHADLDRVLLDTCQSNWIPGLVARGGNINARDTKGNTPIFQSCSLDGLQALLTAGADPTLRNNAGQTAVQATYPPQNGKEDERAKLIREFSAGK